jgi:hypothetical protein
LAKDARDAKRLVFVLDERDGPGAVRNNDRVANLVAERLRHIGTDHGIEQVAERADRR